MEVCCEMLELQLDMSLLAVVGSSSKCLNITQISNHLLVFAKFTDAELDSQERCDSKSDKLLYKEIRNKVLPFTPRDPSLSDL